MFDGSVYKKRREQLGKEVGSGLILLLGNDEVGMNYRANPFHYRQDSSFLYFFRVDLPGLAGLIDIDEGTETLFGDDLTVDDTIWTGPQPTMRDHCQSASIDSCAPYGELEAKLKAAIQQGRRVHFLQPYRAEHTLKLTHLLGIKPDLVNAYRSESLHRAVCSQRNVKCPVEIAEIEKAVNVSREMYLEAMKGARPGRYEYELVGDIVKVAKSHHCESSFPIICSVHGETLHNHHHGNRMEAGDVLVLDSGVETVNKYASDITRVLPVGGSFTSQQKTIYQAVLRAQMTAIEAIQPGRSYREIHLMAAKSMATDLKSLGLMKGDMDEAVAAGAHAMFFPHGLGHMLGMDVHDGENIGEQFVGYEKGLERSSQFGLAYLRLARTLKSGYVLTVEPGIYFIPELIDQWKAEKRFEAFINYAEVEKYRGARGYRIEDDVLVTDAGHRVLGQPIPKSVEDVEAACRG